MNLKKQIFQQGKFNFNSCFASQYSQSQNSSSVLTSSFLSFLETDFSVGDPVVLSDSKVFGISIGYVESITNDSIGLNLEKDLSFQSYQNTQNRVRLYRIDKDILSSGYNTLRENVLKIILNSNNKNNRWNRLRELIIDQKEPKFVVYENNDFQLQLDSKINEDQRNIIKRAMSSIYRLRISARLYADTRNAWYW